MNIEISLLLLPSSREALPLGLELRKSMATFFVAIAKVIQLLYIRKFSARQLRYVLMLDTKAENLSIEWGASVGGACFFHRIVVSCGA